MNQREQLIRNRTRWRKRQERLERMNHYLYRITCIHPDIYGLTYVGMRSCLCPIDQDARYTGSGIDITRIKNKHGTKYLKKEILCIGGSREYISMLEQRYLRGNYLNEQHVLNRRVGGGFTEYKHRVDTPTPAEKSNKRWNSNRQKGKKGYIACYDIYKNSVTSMSCEEYKNSLIPYNKRWKTYGKYIPLGSSIYKDIKTYGVRSLPEKERTRELKQLLGRKNA